MGALIKRVVQLGINSGFKTKINVGFVPTSSFVSKQSPYDYGYRRHLSHIVDTLAVEHHFSMLKFEGEKLHTDIEQNFEKLRIDIEKMHRDLINKLEKIQFTV
ncbi:hypothetical protein L1987_76670 [Smallanthus sonchifolius]|uniref:Uncharacterized protein n=1 Tax=Smallanthus sonchifolius TaxID=185202 RepID=A0ACB8Z703_9ASTR|nr:hypothetical protein L1987_76670 [Smallanthus sonchifolius]